VLAVELANRESRSSWRDFLSGLNLSGLNLSGLKKRGLTGVEFVVSDNHEGLKAAIREVLPEAVWQRCYVHFLRNALDYVPRKSLPPRRRGWTTTACRSCAGLSLSSGRRSRTRGTAAISPSPARHRGLARKVAGQISAAV
jgi:transposase-like protein